jgi:purine-binding chemotaxis protein CheW
MTSMSDGASPPGTQQRQQAGELLTFLLDNETFGIEVDRVHEVLDMPPVTRVPNTRDFAPGIANVRGNVVPLVDLRRKLPMAPAPVGTAMRVIVTEVELGGEHTLVGLMADAVYEVIDATSVPMDEIPRLGTRWPAQFIRGVVKQDHKFVVVLDIPTILDAGETANRPSAPLE